MCDEAYLSLSNMSSTWLVSWTLTNRLVTISLDVSHQPFAEWLLIYPVYLTVIWHYMTPCNCPQSQSQSLLSAPTKKRLFVHNPTLRSSPSSFSKPEKTQILTKLKRASNHFRCIQISKTYSFEAEDPITLKLEYKIWEIAKQYWPYLQMPCAVNLRVHGCQSHRGRMRDIHTYRWTTAELT